MAGMITSRACLAWDQRVAFRVLVDRFGELVGTRLQLVDRLDDLVQMGRLSLGNSCAGGLEAGDRPGDFLLIPKRSRQDHPRGHLQRELALDVDRLAVALDIRSRSASEAPGR